MSQGPMNPQSAVDGRYLLDAPLDAWGVGEGWAARDKNFRNRAVALEFLAAEHVELAAERSQDLRVQRALKHPCVLPIINQGVHQGRPWVAYDGFEGVSLARFLDDERRARGQVDAATVKDLFAKVLDGVGAAHEASTAVLHGCLSPRSVLVKPDGAVKLIDFALGPFASAEVLGPFRAPELAASPDAVTLASEVYALGALLAEMLQPQGVGDARRALESFLAGLQREGGLHVGRQQRPDLAPAVWETLARATRREPAARWDDTASFRKALDAAWAAAPLPPARAPVARAPTMAPIAAPAPRAMTAAMPPVRPAGVPSAAPLPLSGPLPPVAPSVPAGPAFSTPAPLAPLTPPAPATPAFSAPPVAAFSAAQPFASASQPPPPPAQPVSPSAWDSGANPGDAWATLKPAGQSQARAALASAWDAPAPVPAPPVAPQGPWNAGAAHPSWEPGAFSAAALGAPPPRSAPVAGTHGSDDWEDETNASASHPLKGKIPLAIAPGAADVHAQYGALDRQESTMALDLDSLTAAGALQGFAPAPVAPKPSTARPSNPGDDDWKDSVVVLDTARGAPPPDDDDIDVPEPGSRTHVASAAPIFDAPVQPLDSLETLRPMQRPAGIEPFMPRSVTGAIPADAEATFVATGLADAVPMRPATVAPVGTPAMAPMVPAPPVSERTMALDLDGVVLPGAPLPGAPLPGAPMMGSPMHGGPMAPMGSPAMQPIAQTVQAPMGMAPGAPRPPAPLAPPPEAPPSKMPIVIAVIVALLLIGGAVAVVLTRR